MVNPYWKFVLQVAPRILSQIDRDPDSPTYGCCDRNFWHYKMRDFSSAILQQSGLALGLLYQHDFPGNIYHHQEEIKQLSLATVQYWARIQHYDGSVDEYWPHEHSFPATVFSLFAAAELCKLFRVTDKKVLRAIQKSATYLVQNTETQALNQEIASLAALYNAALAVQSSQLVEEAEKKMQRLLAVQQEEGWFSEYGGADMGYLTVSLNFMGEYYLLSQDPRAKKSMVKMIHFLQCFVHPDGSFGGDYGSRNTEYFLPAGFEIANDALGQRIVQHLLHYAEQNLSIDDRYWTHYVFLSFVRAGMFHRERKTETQKLPHEEEGKWYFPKAGLQVTSTKKYYSILALSKGGVLVIFDKKSKQRMLNDCGYRAFVGQKLFVSNWSNTEYTAQETPTGLTLRSPFYHVSFHTPTPFQHFLLRCSSLLLGKRMIGVMKRKFILPSKPSPIMLERNVVWTEKEVEIQDTVTTPFELDLVKSSEGLSVRFCPSSRFYQTSALRRQHYPFEARKVKEVKVRKVVL